MRARKLWIGSFFGLAALAPATLSAQEIASPKWTPWVEFGGFYGSNDTSRGEAVLWVPLAQSQTSVLFGEARGKLFEDDMREGNFALGYRQMQANGWNIGVWGGYDIRRSEFGNTFHQLAGGIEALSDRWDFRANAYLPLNDSEIVFTATALASNSVVELSGNQIGMVTTVTSTTRTMEELALWGFDAEIGAKIFSTPLDLTGPHHELRIYAGAYHFDHSDLPSCVTGPRVRAEWRMDDVIDQWAGSRLTLEAEYSHDQLRDDRVEVGARLRLPFGDNSTRVASRSLTAQERRMADGLERDTDIVTGTATTASSRIVSTATEDVEDAKTGVRFDRVAMADAGTDIATASTAAGANSLIIATGNISGAQSIEADQTVQGGGSTIQVRGAVSGIVLDFTAPGARPTLTNTADSAVLAVGGSNTHIAGMDLIGSGQHSGMFNNVGVHVGTNNTNVHIDGVNVSATGDASIWVPVSNSVHISNAGLTGAGGHGVFINQNNTVEISNTEIVATRGAGIVADTGNTVSVTDTALRDTAGNAISLYTGNTAAVSRTTIENIGGNGISVVFTGNDVTFSDSTLQSDIGIRGIFVIFAGNTLSGAGNTAGGATFGHSFCDTAAGVTGTLSFDIGNCPP